MDNKVLITEFDCRQFFSSNLPDKLAQLEPTILTYNTYGPVDRLAAAVRIVLGILAQTRIVATLGKFLVSFFLIGISSLTSTGISTRTSTVLYVYKRKADCIIEILYTNEGDRFDN